MADLPIGAATTLREGCRFERGEPVYQAETGRIGLVLYTTRVNRCELVSVAFEGADYVAQVPASSLEHARTSTLDQAQVAAAAPGPGGGSPALGRARTRRQPRPGRA